MQKLHEIGEESPDIINNIHYYIEKIIWKENKPNNAIQNDDFDEPDNTISIKTFKIINNIKRNRTKNFILSKGKTKYGWNWR